ncbi:MAG TPA: hypothetical protein VK569_11110 [Bacteroidota bacterium]|nr:hypothetical protein [Bacteroidota bacterium]
MSESTNRGRSPALVLATTCAVLAAALSGCSDEPTTANAPVVSLPLTTLLTRDTSIVAVGSSTYRQYIPTNGPVNLVGRSGNYTAMALIEFTSLPARDTALVYSANLTLRFETWFGDSSGQFSFNIYRILIPWNQATATWDTVQAPGWYEQYVARGSYSAGAAKDTQSVTIPLDTAMVRQWWSPSSTTYSPWGLLLVPTSGCSMVRGFHEYGYTTDSASAGYYPSLQIIAGSPAGTPLDTATYSVSFDTWVGNVENLATNPQLIYIQSGVDYKSTLTFDVSFIPKGAVINSADLLLTNDPATTRLNRFMIASSFNLATTLSSSSKTALDLYPVSGSRRTGNLLTYAADMTRPVQIWNTLPNYGVTLSPGPTDETTSFELLTFFNEKAPPSLRPRLKLKYSVVR